MHHRKSGRKLNRKRSHYNAMFRNMSASLIKHELIKTTLAKAKELRGIVEPLITLAKTDTVANRRLAFARLRDDAAVFKLFTEVGQRHQDRPGGYLRVLKCGFRNGDNAPMAIVELVDRLEYRDSCEGHHNCQHDHDHDHEHDHEHTDEQHLEHQQAESASDATDTATASTDAAAPQH